MVVFGGGAKTDFTEAACKADRQEERNARSFETQT